MIEVLKTIHITWKHKILLHLFYITLPFPVSLIEASVTALSSLAVIFVISFLSAENKSDICIDELHSLSYHIKLKKGTRYFTFISSFIRVCSDGRIDRKTSCLFRIYRIYNIKKYNLLFIIIISII